MTHSNELDVAKSAEAELPDHLYGKNYGRMPVGTQPQKSVDYLDLVEADPGETPPVVSAPGNYRPKRRRVSYDRYWDPEIAKLEDEHIWKKMWLCAGREEDIPNVGDRMVFDIRDKSYLIVRSAPDKIQAFHNSCRHRGNMLCTGKGHSDNIRCPFHAWTWNLDGSQAWVPEAEDFPGGGRGRFNLIDVQCETWGGNIFINADRDAPPLASALGVMVDFFKDWNEEERYTKVFLRAKVRANWKVAQEAFQEAYHVTETHWDAIALFAATDTTIDCWEDEHSHIGRLITPTGMPSGYLADKCTIREAVEQYAKLYNGVEAEPGRGETVEDARNYLAELKRQQLARERGTDMSDAPNSMLLDFVKFFMFPNFHPWWGEQFPITYRFIPYGMNPEECIVEIRELAPVPKDGPRPESAKPVEVGFDQSCADFPELGLAGYIASQDISNMRTVQRGMRAAAATNNWPMLADYQEDQITHFHEKYDQILGLNKKGEIDHASAQLIKLKQAESEKDI